MHVHTNPQHFGNRAVGTKTGQGWKGSKAASVCFSLSLCCLPPHSLSLSLFSLCCLSTSLPLLFTKHTHTHTENSVCVCVCVCGDAIQVSSVAMATGAPPPPPPCHWFVCLIHPLRQNMQTRLMHQSRMAEKGPCAARPDEEHSTLRINGSQWDPFPAGAQYYVSSPSGRLLSAPVVRDHEVVITCLFKREAGWK